MTKLIALGMGTFFLWCLTTLNQNAITQLSELGYVDKAQSLILPMWLFFSAFVVSLLATLLVALQSLRQSND